MIKKRRMSGPEYYRGTKQVADAPWSRPGRPHGLLRQALSRTIDELILLAPRSRSANVIGTSTTRWPVPVRAPGEVDLEAVALARRRR